MRFVARGGLAVVVSIAGCRGDGRAERAADSTTAVAPTASSVGATAQPATGGAAADKLTCPATGQWAFCSVMERLDRSGLAPRRDSGDVRLDPLTRPGVRVTVGSAELDLFIYPDPEARKRDEDRLDKKRFIEATDPPTLRGEPTVIRSVNLLAILRSRSDRQRERVSDALTAGPPQAAAAVPIEGAKVPR
jgi:hypothetical protein